MKNKPLCSKKRLYDASSRLKLALPEWLVQQNNSSEGDAKETEEGVIDLSKPTFFYELRQTAPHAES
jgi:hypothetical protein